MKKVLLGALAIAAMASCGKNDVNGDGSKPGPDGLVPIELNTSVVSVQSKATGTPIVPGTWDDDNDASTPEVAVKFKPTFIGYEGTTEPNYGSATANWVTTGEMEIANTAKAVTFDPAQYYNASNAIKTYVLGVYPKISEAASAITAGKVTFATKDGYQDAMLAFGATNTTSISVSGSKDNKVSEALMFKHLTTQLNFQMIKAASYKDFVIKECKINEAKLPTGIDLYAKGATWDATAAALVINTELKGKPVAGTPGAAEDDPNTADVDETQPVPAPMGIVMIKPGEKVIMTITAGPDATQAPYGKTNSYDPTADDVTYTVTVSDQTVTPKVGPELKESNAHKVTLTFTLQGIDVQAGVTDWTPGTDINCPVM